MSPTLELNALYGDAGRSCTAGNHACTAHDVSPSRSSTYITKANHSPASDRRHSNTSPSKGPGSSTGPATRQCRDRRRDVLPDDELPSDDDELLVGRSFKGTPPRDGGAD